MQSIKSHFCPKISKSLNRAPDSKILHLMEIGNETRISGPPVDKFKAKCQVKALLNESRALSET